MRGGGGREEGSPQAGRSRGEEARAAAQEGREAGGQGVRRPQGGGAAGDDANAGPDPPGRRAGTGCGEPADDTIYFGERLGRQVYQSIGDFGVAYALAHEYAHNVQQELGWFSEGARLTTAARSAVRTAYAVGDFDLTNPQHHGTPEERADAWLQGYRSGDPSLCRRFV